MNAVVKVDPMQLIETTTIDSQLYEDEKLLLEVSSMFIDGVLELKTFLTDGAILHIPVSQGKDSTIVELMALEAYKQCIEERSIEKTRPLILSTVDTGGEAIPMKMYVSYARKRIFNYAKQHNINLFYDIVMPAINDEYFVKFTGGQKLIPNATRRGDCSIILKVDPSERYVKNIIKQFTDSENGADTLYKNVITCVGSRLEESSRRAKNMKNQGVSTKNANDLMKEVQADSLGDVTLLKYAPIKHWTTDQVFDALRIAGAKPLMKLFSKPSAQIPAFLPNFGLLIEIYGNGSNETCDISVGSKASSGCNGKARFGCVYCTMVAVKDHSSSALAQLERWRVLGAENALRVRDFLFRLSCDIDARALHARAYDPVGFNRIALQPNTLKPKHLEKMVRFASQLSLDSIRKASEFSELVAQDRLMEHSGYREIVEDINMPPKTKKAFLEMYVECSQDPKNLNYLFSENHAILLSFRWSIDGIGAAPYRPLAIWKQLESGKGWIPYPKLNDELPKDSPALSLNGGKALPEAIMFPILKNEDAAEHALSPSPLLSLWERPRDIADLYDEDMNCSVTRKSTHEVKTHIEYSADVSISPATEVSPTYYPINAVIEGNARIFSLNINDVSINKIKLNGKVMKGLALEALIDRGALSQVQDHVHEKASQIITRLNHKSLSGGETEVKQVIDNYVQSVLAKENVITRHVGYLKASTMLTGYQSKARKTEKIVQFTKRVSKVVKKKVLKGNTRMSFYGHQVDSSLHLAHQQEVSFLKPSFSSYTQKFIGSHDASLLPDEEAVMMENIMVDEAKLSLWRELGGLTSALSEHDQYFESMITKRHIRKLKSNDVRNYGGTHVAEQLLAEGVISIEKRYWSQLQAILKRTQIFNTLNMFRFQSMSYDDVVQHPKAISMRQHRSDKVTVLSIIRQHRNEQRRLVKASIDKHNMSIITANLAVFKDTAIASINLATHNQFNDLLNVNFNTDDISPKHKASIANLWIALYLQEVNHADHVLSKVLTASQFKTLKSEPSDYLAVGKLAISTIKDIQAHIQVSISKWDNMNKALTALEANIGDDRDKALAQYRALIEQYAPSEFYEKGHVDFWRPNMDNLRSGIKHKSGKLQAQMSHMETLKATLSAITEQSARQISTKFTLADKLALIRQRKAA